MRTEKAQVCPHMPEDTFSHDAAYNEDDETNFSQFRGIRGEMIYFQVREENCSCLLLTRGVVAFHIK